MKGKIAALQSIMISNAFASSQLHHTGTNVGSVSKRSLHFGHKEDFFLKCSFDCPRFASS